MYYHASQTPDIQILEPRISNHNRPLIYFSTRRENVLVYLSNAVEKYCKETHFDYDGPWKKWGPYGFEADGTLRFEEYYPNALEDTYQGVSGYIYHVEHLNTPQNNIQINHAVTCTDSVPVDGFEFVPDAYEAIMKASQQGLLKILRYEEQSDRMLAWIKRTMHEEYNTTADHPEYRHFLKGKFPFL